jgi:hypothetical protein
VHFGFANIRNNHNNPNINEIHAKMNEILSIFIDNRINLSTLNQRDSYTLFQQIIKFTHFEETDNKIIEAYANANLRQNITWMDYEFSEWIRVLEKDIEEIRRGDLDEEFDTEEKKEDVINDYKNQIKNVKRIFNIIRKSQSPR